jgi:ribokinase
MASMRYPVQPAGVQIVVVGSSMVDLIAYASRTPHAGETVQGDNFQTGAGGKGANQAVMAARLGSIVSFAGRVGTDSYAQLTRDSLGAEGIDLRHLGVADGPSGIASIWVDSDGSNSIIIIPGANSFFTPEDARNAVLASPDVAIVLAQLETPIESTVAAFTQAHAQGALTILNPAPWCELGPEILENCDWIIPNEHEFASLARQVGVDGDEALEESIGAVARLLGVSLVVTRGARDVVIARLGTLTTVAVERVDPVDTTGAGDAFVGAFAHGLANGMDAVAAAELASRCATASVLGRGTQSSYPTR